MGFLDHSTNNIIVDAVLTDHGRSLIAATGTQSSIIQGYSFADDEVDYTIIKKYGVAVGKEKIEKNTPIFEASTNTANVVSSFLYTSDSLGTAIRLNLTWTLPDPTESIAGADVGKSQDVYLNIVPLGMVSGDSYTLNVEFDNNMLTYQTGTDHPRYPSTDMLPNMRYAEVPISFGSTPGTQHFKTTGFTGSSTLGAVADNTIMPTMVFVGGSSGGVSTSSIQLKIINATQA